ncbi:MAG: hypothetical protein Q7T61_20365 [Caulobacter sp.]|nr:hypothetical protein [Caulobacter sp.]
MKRTVILVAALAALAGAGQASAGGFLEGLARQKAESLVSKALDGDLKAGKTAAKGGAGSGFQSYGPWDFKLEDLKVGPDEQWQAVIGVRNAAGFRQGMVASEIKVFLITEDGETLANWGELYKASVEGASSGLEPLATLWLEDGDEARVRIRFANSRDIKPVKIRIQSTGATAQIRTFPVG